MTTLDRVEKLTDAMPKLLAACKKAELYLSGGVMTKLENVRQPDGRIIMERVPTYRSKVHDELSSALQDVLNLLKEPK